ncbi:GSCFA domain-containing protein [Psychroflexus tropicus]|uniref:GSCFA domain-containing protein n=1 Tax=Psychroflexus tropicus TaxID=197345 RepID=UPI0003717092|nr:GSCFA domain-containing protein [Psychroflexus tropicus]
MKLSTEVSIAKASNPLTYDSKVLCLGSCFAEHISDKLNYFKFQVTSNPFGILFHPEAILNVVEKAVNDQEFTSEDVFQHNDMWHSFFSHSRLSRSSSAETLAELNSAKNKLTQAIAESSHIILTLGTSFIYRQKSTRQGVANCHKVPQDQFEKKLSTIDELQRTLNQLISKAKELNPDVNFIFTISPVRHTKDGIVENQRSKAHLISALHQVLEKQSNADYFPSYELMLDEFRDYRFYNRDLIHPNELAIDLIWEKFKLNYIEDNLKKDMAKVDKLQKSIAHRPIAVSGIEFQKLKAYQHNLKEELQSNYPFMNFQTL